MRLSGQSFKLKLVTFGILLGTFPVISVGTISYFIAAGKIIDMAVASNSQILYQTEQRVEQTFKTLDTAVTQFISSPDTSSAMHVKLGQYDFQTVKGFELLVHKMHHLQTFEYGVHDVYLINPDHRWVIRNDGIYSFDQLKPEDQAQVQLYLSSGKQSIWMKDQYVVADSGSVIDKEAQYASSFYQGGISLVKKISGGKGAIVAKISTGELEKLLLKSSKLGNVMLLDDNYQLLAYQEGIGMKEAVESNTWMNHLKSLSDREGYYEEDLSGIRALVSYRKSEYSGIVYVSIVSVETMASETAVIKWVTIAAGMIVIGVILVFTWFGTRRMYSPIRKLHDIIVENGAQYPPNPRGKDEFQWMGEQIYKQQLQLRAFFALRLCLGEVKENELGSKLALDNDGSRWHLFSVVSVHIEAFEETRYRGGDRDLLMFAVSNIICELIPPHRRFHPLMMDQTIVTITNSVETDPVSFKSELYTWVEKSQQAIDHYLHLKISVGISHIYENLIKTDAAYRQSLDALKYRALGQQSILFFGDLYPEPVCKQQLSPLLEAALFDAIKSGDVEKAYEQLEQVLAFTVQAQLPPLEVQMLLMRLVTDTLRMAQDAGLSATEIFADQSLIDQLIRLNSMREIENWLKKKVIEPIIERMEKQRNTQFKKISGELIRIIHEGYEQELTLESCAAAVNYNPNYVSRVFRQEMGMTFSEYLSQYRLSVAKNWLTETDMKIGEIAERLCYSTTTNFIRYFRKVEGVTPGDYRKCH